MKKLILLLSLFSSPAYGGVPCSLPFNLQNGQPADATQVMANYNALVTCLGNAAAAGANSDITALTGLTVPIPPTAGGTQTYVATAPSTGPANAQIVAATTPAGFALTAGYTVVFIAGATNTGAVTLQVGATAITNVFRRTTDGLLNTAGGEIIAGTLTIATFDGTQFQLALSQVPIATVVDTGSVNPDPGFLLLQGQCVSTSAYAALWTKFGTPAPGTCAAGQFRLPDGRGRVIAMIDSGGSNRITNAGGNWDGTVLGNAGGIQQLPQSALPNVGLSVSISGSGSYTRFTPGNEFSYNPAFTSGSGFSNYVFPNNTATGSTQTVSVSGSGSTSSLNGGVTETGSLPPTLMLNRQIKF